MAHPFDPIEEMREIRSQFLDVAIEIEAFIRFLVSTYYVDDLDTRREFQERFLDKATLGTLGDHLKEILRIHKSRLPEPFPLDDFLSSLSSVTKTRNRFAHHPIGLNMFVKESAPDQSWMVVGHQAVVAKPGSDLHMNAEDVRQAIIMANKCYGMLEQVREALWRVIKTRPGWND